MPCIGQTTASIWYLLLKTVNWLYGTLTPPTNCTPSRFVLLGWWQLPTLPLEILSPVVAWITFAPSTTSLLAMALFDLLENYLLMLAIWVVVDFWMIVVFWQVLEIWLASFGTLMQASRLMNLLIIWVMWWVCPSTPMTPTCLSRVLVIQLLKFGISERDLACKHSLDTKATSILCSKFFLLWRGFQWIQEHID